jgi:DNA-binding transcriptional ArsR family regulator
MPKGAQSTVDLSGDELLRLLGTLANPHRLRVVAALAEERNYVSQLARELGISRALLQVHLRKLEAAGLVSADIEVSADGKAMKYYEVTPFTVLLTPAAIEAAVRTLTAVSDLPTSLTANGLSLPLAVWNQAPGKEGALTKRSRQEENHDDRCRHSADRGGGNP